MLDDVLVIVLSEFGRTPRINGHVGRDHWPEAWSLVMGGCGIKRGVVVGKTNDMGTFVTSDELDIGAHVPHLVRGPGHRSEEDRIRQQRPTAADRPRGLPPVKELLA